MQQVPFTYSGNQWVGFDNQRSVRVKAAYAKSRGLAGVMVWSIEQDDARGICGMGKFPLINAVREGLDTAPVGPNPTTPKPGPNTTTSTTTKATTTKTTTTTTKAPSTGTSCTQPGYLRDSNDCSVFYVCERLYNG